MDHQCLLLLFAFAKAASSIAHCSPSPQTQVIMDNLLLIESHFRKTGRCGLTTVCQVWGAAYLLAPLAC